MARYRQKDPTDLAWNQIRRRITRELDLQIADWREDKLNQLLPAAFDKFSKRLNSGEVIEIESDYEPWVARSLNEAGVGEELANEIEED